MILQKKQNHAEEAVGNLIQQFKGKPTLEELIKLFADQVQEIENGLFDLLYLRSIDEAIGVQLDGLGRLLNLEREGRGRDDATYRQWLKARILLILSGGTPEDVIGLVRALIGNNKIEILESFPAHFDVKINEPISVDGYQVASLILSGTPAGVRGIFIWTAPGTHFVFEGAPDGMGFDKGEFAGAVDF